MSDLSEKPTQIGSIGETSISDNPTYLGYLKVVELASTDENVFEDFRIYREYREVLEHVSHHQGVQYLEVIKNFDVNFREVVTIIKEIDYINNAIRYNYKQIGNLSPSLLRYGAIGLDIKKRFGSNFKSVYEVGCGYGGQGLVLDRLCIVHDYTFVDLPNVLQLARLFTSQLHNRARFHFENETKQDTEIDLFISNYAFSELNREVQLRIMEDVIPRSRSGYMLLNKLGESYLGSHSYNELLQAIPDSKLYDETPNTYPGNALLVWGEGQASSRTI